MELIFGGILIAGIILIANLLVLRNNETEKRIFRWLLFLINLPLLFVGLMLLLIPADIWDQLYQDAPQQLFSGEALKAMGPSIIFMALWGMATSLKIIQEFLARWIPIQPGSPVHTLALVLAGYLMGNTALTLSQGGLEALAETAEPTNLSFFVLSEFLFAAVGFLGIGILIRRNWRELMERMGLVRPTVSQLIQGVGWIIILVFLQFIAGAAWAVLNPEEFANLEAINAALLGEIDTVWEWLILALAAGIGEEILFRGAIQPVFGLLLTSVIFAVVHVQYGFSPITLFVIFLAIILGLIRHRTNTTVAIFVHVGYDFVLGLLALLAVWAEQFLP